LRYEKLHLPPYRHRGPCPRCGGRGPIRVHFDRDCSEVPGNDYHRECPGCGARWLEQCARASVGRAV